MASALARIAARRTAWLVLLAWVVVLGGLLAANLPGRFEDAQTNETESFLPAEAESTQVLEVTGGLRGGEAAPMVVVYRREGGLTAGDRRTIAAARAAFNRELPPATSPLSAPIPSPDGSAALLRATVTFTDDPEVVLDAVEAAREGISDPGGGLEAKVSGPAGFQADATAAAQSINGTLLAATAALVFVLLLLIYRSPIFWAVPLIAVAAAELSSRALGYGLSELGVTINGQTAGILPVLVFGAGTDYALLLVARYREELRRHEDRGVALARALRSAGPAILASGLTVVAALLCLTLADVNSTAGLGPIGAGGVAVAMIAMLTLLPALLAICGRWVFWPFVPRVGSASPPEASGAWSRLGSALVRRPRVAWVSLSCLLVVLALGLAGFDDGLTRGNSFRSEVESVQGQELLTRAFPAGTNAPTEIIVPDAGRAEAVADAVSEVPGVAEVREAERGAAGALLSVVLDRDPYAPASFELVPEIREAAKRAGGPGTLVGGATAVERDLRVASARDTRLIMPITLAVVFLILVGLLRALVAPLVLIATVILSFAAALGVGVVVFDVVFGFPGADPSLPLLAFIFLVALGVDYNIFLMARVREETLVHGTRGGMLRGLTATGGVITSAGIVLAGTFTTLAVLPFVFLTEIGFVVAFGVLLDTFLVRSALVPAVVLDLGRRTWLPSALARRAEPTPAGRQAPGG